MTALAAGEEHSLALTSDGKLKPGVLTLSCRPPSPSELAGKTVTAFAAGDLALESRKSRCRLGYMTHVSSTAAYICP